MAIIGWQRWLPNRNSAANAARFFLQTGGWWLPTLFQVGE
jgi:hypothetical protein